MTDFDEIKYKILESTDIVDVVSDVVQLRRRGINFIGLCPFHTEKTPSFTVSSDKGIYKCFGCGKSGNSITFMIDYYNMDYPEAIKELARRAGVTIPEKPKGKKQTESLSQREQVQIALALACELYKKMLTTPSGKIADTYIKKREFTKATQQFFGIGYSPNSWDTLITELKKQKITEKTMFDAGLILENDKGGYYDRFRDRLMFPIHDIMGKVVGFGARQLNDDKNQPKYINSPQTIVYDKSRLLYGLYFAKNEIRAKSSVILVEGYADVISLYQAGIKNVVASSGTSLTKEQLNILIKYCKSIYIVYDADSAGVSATVRGLELALIQGFEVHIVLLPKGEDPDSLVRIHGHKVFNKYLEDAISFVDFKYQQFIASPHSNSPQERSKAIREIIGLISKIPDRLQHDDYITKLAALFLLSPTQLERIYSEKLILEHNTEERESQHRENNENYSHKSAEQKDQVENNENTALKPNYEELMPEELVILKSLISNTELRREVYSRGLINQDTMFSPHGKRLLSIVLSLLDKSNDIIQTIIESPDINEYDKNFISDLLLKDESISVSWSKFSKTLPDYDVIRPINDAIIKIEIKKIDAEISEIMLRLQTNASIEPTDDLHKYNLLKNKKMEYLGKLS